MVHYSPLRPGREVVFEIFNTTRRSLGKSLDRSVRAVAHVTYDLMFGRCALRKETIPDPLHVASYYKLPRYLHLTSSPGFPFSKVNVSSSESPTFRVKVIVLPLIVPV